MSEKKEQVLVIPTEALRKAGMFQGFSDKVDHYTDELLLKTNPHFMPRDLAEEDPEFKQIIPYMVLVCGPEIFYYTRGSGSAEKRLHAKRSIGVGGHINPKDSKPGQSTLLAAMIRELQEEVIVSTNYTERRIGFLNDDSTPVGKVHLGLVHLITLEAPKVTRREEDIMASGFGKVADLIREFSVFETWSQFVLEQFWAET